MAIKKDFNIKEVTARVKQLARDFGIDEAHRRIKEDYKFYPQLRKTMLFILYDEYHFYHFEEKEDLK